MEKQKERDNKMYNFNKDNVQAFERRVNKIEGGLKFNDNLPNNLNLRRPGSRIDLDNENVTDSMN